MSGISTQLKYSIRDLFVNLKINIIIIINAALLVYIMSIVSLQVSGIIVGYKEILKSDIYDKQYSFIVTSESNNYNYNTIYNSENLNKYREFYSWMDNEFDIVAIAPNISTEISYTNIPYANEYYVNDNFINDVLEPNVAKGNNQLYNVSSKFSPIIMGSNYADKYDVGDILNEKYRVGAILKEGSSYYDFRTGYYPQYLDDGIFLPINIEELDAISYSLIFERLLININDITELQSINNKALELEINRFNFISEKEQFYRCIEADKGYLSFNIFYQITILLLSCTCSIFISIYKCKSNINDYKFHFICGATKIDIWRRIAYENIMIVAVSMLLDISVIVGLLKVSMSEITLVMGIVSIIYILILNLVSIIYVRRNIIL